VTLLRKLALSSAPNWPGHAFGSSAITLRAATGADLMSRRSYINLKKRRSRVKKIGLAALEGTDARKSCPTASSRTHPVLDVMSTTLIDIEEWIDRFGEELIRAETVASGASESRLPRLRAAHADSRAYLAGFGRPREAVEDAACAPALLH
jgi:hypothetical protein